MTKTFQVIRVFVASPGDTQEERLAVAEIIGLMNKAELLDTGIRLGRVAYETDVTPDIGSDPQSIINSQIGDEWDIFVGILKTRFGTPTPRAGSGTEEEFRNAVARRANDERCCKVLFYFGDVTISTSSLSNADLQQLTKINDFKAEFSKNGIYFPFRNTMTFREALRSHLNQTLKSYGDKWGPSKDNLETQVELSEPNSLEDLIEEAQSALDLSTGSLNRITSGYLTYAHKMEPKKTEFDQVISVQDSFDKKTQEFYKSVSDIYNDCEKVFLNELPLYESYKNKVKDSIHKIIGFLNLESDTHVGFTKALIKSLKENSSDINSQLESGKGFRSKILQIAQDFEALRPAAMRLAIQITLYDSLSAKIWSDQQALVLLLENLLGTND